MTTDNEPSENNPPEPQQSEPSAGPAPEASPPPGKSCPLRALMCMRVSVIEAILVLVFVLSLMGYWSFLGWVADLPSHFKMQYAEIQLFCLVVMILKKKPQWILIALLGLGMNVAELAPDFLPDETELPAPKSSALQSSAPPLKVIGHIRLMHMNVLLKNHNYNQAMDAISAYNPDIISLQEVDPAWLDKISPILKNYPYHIQAIQPNRYFGIALYSKLPFRKSKIHFFGDVQRPNLLIALQFKNQIITLLATHPQSPGSPARYARRNRQLMGIARERGSLGPHLVVVGDLNTTPYSTTFKDFIAATGLRDSRRGFGYQASWPSFFPPLWIPIDHVLVSDFIRVRERKIGPAFGSDHLPVLAELEVLEMPPMPEMPHSQGQQGASPHQVIPNEHYFDEPEPQPLKSSDLQNNHDSSTRELPKI